MACTPGGATMTEVTFLSSMFRFVTDGKRCSWSSQTERSVEFGFVGPCQKFEPL
jgi:hypothetical protein